jgi:hypothetical protein
MIKEDSNFSAHHPTDATKKQQAERALLRLQAR